jgi:hypothetical protein
LRGHPAPQAEAPDRGWIAAAGAPHDGGDRPKRCRPCGADGPTDRGELILDNERDAVLPWNKTGYEFIKREGSDGTAWVALGGEQDRIVVASRSASRKQATLRR